MERTEIVFEDRMIESAVREALGVGYGTLYNEDVEQVTELNIVGYSVYRPGMSALFTEDSYSVQTGGWGYNSSSLGRLETLDDLKAVHALPKAAAYCLPGGGGHHRGRGGKTAGGALADPCRGSGFVSGCR